MTWTCIKNLKPTNTRCTGTEANRENTFGKAEYKVESRSKKVYADGLGIRS